MKPETPLLPATVLKSFLLSSLLCLITLFSQPPEAIAADEYLNIQDELDGYSLKKTSRFKAIICRPESAQTLNRGLCSALSVATSPADSPSNYAQDSPSQSHHSQEDHGTHSQQAVSLTQVAVNIPNSAAQIPVDTIVMVFTAPHEQTHMGWEAIALYDPTANEIVHVTNDVNEHQSATIDLMTENHDVLGSAALIGGDGGMYFPLFTSSQLEQMQFKDSANTLYKVASDFTDAYRKMTREGQSRVNSVITAKIPLIQHYWDTALLGLSIIKKRWPVITSVALIPWTLTGLVEYLYKQQLTDYILEYEPQPAYNLTGCHLHVEVLTQELYTDLKNNQITPIIYDATEPVETIISHLDNITSTKFRTYGSFVEFLTSSVNCRCPDCPGDATNSQTDLAGCDVFVQTQTDVLSNDIKTQRNYQYNSALNQNTRIEGTLLFTEGEEKDSPNSNRVCGCTLCSPIATQASQNSVEGILFTVHAGHTAFWVAAISGGILLYKYCWLSRHQKAD